MSRSLASARPQPVGSCRMAMLSVMPPVRSDSPSSSVPYLSASYEPWSLRVKGAEWLDRELSRCKVCVCGSCEVAANWWLIRGF